MPFHNETIISPLSRFITDMNSEIKIQNSGHEKKCYEENSGFNNGYEGGGSEVTNTPTRP